MNNILCKLINFFEFIKTRTQQGYKWIGVDGLLNMETSALLTILFALFIPKFYACLVTLFIMTLKSFFDKSKGRINEKHDLICSCIGIIVGFILGLR